MDHRPANDQMKKVRPDAICGGTGNHDGQEANCCDECCEEWSKGATEAGFCAVHDNREDN